MMTNTAAASAVTHKIPVVLTVKDAVQKIKEDCPGTAITENYLRQLIKDGVLPELKAGNKVLINLDVLIEYLTDPTAEKFRPKAKVYSFGGIRPADAGR